MLVITYLCVEGSCAGHELYLSLLAQVPSIPNETNESHQSALKAVFHQFPDDWPTIREQGLAYFRYFVKIDMEASVTTIKPGQATMTTADVSELIEEGKVGYEPIVYEDFLPASAAGIFQSNLAEATSIQNSLKAAARKGEERSDARDTEVSASLSSREVFEQALGGKVRDYWELYEEMEKASLNEVEQALNFQVLT